MGDHDYGVNAYTTYYGLDTISSDTITVGRTTAGTDGWVDYTDNTGYIPVPAVEVYTQEIVVGGWTPIDINTVLNAEIRVDDGIVVIVLGNGQVVQLGKGKILKKDGKIAIQIDSCDVRISEEELDRLSKEREKAHSKNNMMRRIFE